MEYVSSTVAKAIKEAGYPLMRFQTVNRQQFESGHGYKYSTDKTLYSESPSVLYPEDKDTIDLYYCPTYIEVWLWLCNKVTIHPVYNRFRKGWSCEYRSDTRIFDADTFGISDNPETAIITAIEYLVDNNLLK